MPSTCPSMESSMASEELSTCDAALRGATGEKESWSGRRGEKPCPPCASRSMLTVLSPGRTVALDVGPSAGPG